LDSRPGRRLGTRRPHCADLARRHCARPAVPHRLLGDPVGVGEIGGAFAARRRGSSAWGWTLAAGVLNVVFGVLLLIWPASGILILVWLVGIFTLAGGIALIILAFRVRSVARSTDRALGAS
jgi:hypothetical protein